MIRVRVIRVGRIRVLWIEFIIVIYVLSVFLTVRDRVIRVRRIRVPCIEFIIVICP